MWTRENRARYDRSKLRYPSDLTDEEWAVIGPLIPPAKRGGNKRTIDERAVVLSRKNALFASGDDGGRRWADLASLIETCKLNGVNPQVYLTDLLTRPINGWPQSRIDKLMPWHWAPTKTS